MSELACFCPGVRWVEKEKDFLLCVFLSSSCSSIAIYLLRFCLGPKVCAGYFWVEPCSSSLDRERESRINSSEVLRKNCRIWNIKTEAEVLKTPPNKLYLIIHHLWFPFLNTPKVKNYIVIRRGDVSDSFFFVSAGGFLICAESSVMISFNRATQRIWQDRRQLYSSNPLQCTHWHGAEFCPSANYMNFTCLLKNICSDQNELKLKASRGFKIRFSVGERCSASQASTKEISIGLLLSCACPSVLLQGYPPKLRLELG